MTKSLIDLAIFVLTVIGIATVVATILLIAIIAIERD